MRYKTLLRRLQTSFEKKAKSILVGSRCDNQIKYNCSFSTDGKKIGFVSSNCYDFDFTEQVVNVIAYSPDSIKQSENLFEVGDNENRYNKKIYIIDNNYKFNITGTISDKNFNYKKIILNINIKNDINKIINVSCSSIKLNEENYTLNCNSTNIIKVDFNSAISYLG